MFNAERVPVKVYRWDDAGAPQVLPGAGDIKTILKACLVTGYGENENRKEPLGWEMPFENGNDACFRSTHEKSTKWALGVYGEHGYGGCNVVGLKEPTSSTNGMLESYLSDGGNKYRFLYSGSTRQKTKLLRWVVVGHARSFCLIILNNEYAEIGGMLYFGDFISALIADADNCVLMATSNSNDRLGNGEDVISSVIVRDCKKNNAAQAWWVTRGLYNPVYYPNPINKGFMADEIYLSENVDGGGAIRGLLPGVLTTVEKMPSHESLNFGTIFENLDGSNDKWIYFRCVGYRGVLINLTRWEI